MSKTIELSLCHYCASIFYDMPDRTIKRKDMEQDIKELCDICQTGHGYEFVICEADDIKL